MFYGLNLLRYLKKLLNVSRILNLEAIMLDDDYVDGISNSIANKVKSSHK